MYLKYLFNLLSFFHHYRISNYIKKLNFTNLIDVGAHEGEFLTSVVKIKKIKNFFVFEPQSTPFKILSKKFEKNKKIKLYNLALGNIIFFKKLYLSKLTSTSTMSIINKKSLYLKLKNLLIRDKLKIYKKVKVDTIDHIFKHISLKNTFLKIDVEGYEMNVLKGCKKKINEISFVLVECQFGSHYINNNFKKVKDFLLRNNFKFKKSFYFPLLNYKDVLFCRCQDN
jgi:FkbM family methyltransferase